MKTRSPLALAVVLALILATGSSVATGASDTAVKKQRIAIEGTHNSGTQTGKFTLIPLTPGPLKRDSGRFKTVSTGAPGNPPTPFIRNGQSVLQLTGGFSDQMTGKNGTFSLGSQGLELVSAGGVYAVLTGRWGLDRGTGAYAGAGGGGTFVMVSLPGDERFRYEGYVRAG